MGGPYGHMLSEISQTEKDKRHMILLIKWNLKKTKNQAPSTENSVGCQT